MPDILKQFIESPEFKNNNACQIENYQPGDTIMHEGEESLDVYYLLEGHVRINKRVELNDGKQIQSGFCDLGPGDTFGELSMFDQSPRSASVVTTDDVKVVKIDSEVLMNYLDAHPDKAYVLFKDWLQKLACNLRKSNERSSHLFAWGLSRHGIDGEL